MSFGEVTEPVRPLVITGAFSRETCERILSAHPPPHELRRGHLQRFQYPVFAAGGLDAITEIANQAGEHFEIPVGDITHLVRVSYPFGSALGMHTDREGSPFADVALSLSFILNDPYEDYKGGDFVTAWGCVDADIGDAIAVTPYTPHAVSMVTRGIREVAVVFFGPG